MKNYFKRLELISCIRDFFVSRGFVEVYTPCITEGVDISPSIRSFEVDMGLYLSTSPELDMKKLISMGMDRIFQITHFFRKGEFLSTHNPEFLGLEWYEAGKDYFYAMDLVEELVAYVGRKVFGMDVPLPFHRISVEGLFASEGVPPSGIMDGGSLEDLLHSLGVSFPEGLSVDELFNMAFDKLFGGRLGVEGPVIVYDFPSYLPSLAKRKGDISERFELFVGGFEVGNAYNEIVDPSENRRVLVESRLGAILSGCTGGIDREFLEISLPDPTTGMALGIDRLYMGLSGVGSMDDILLPFERSRFRNKGLSKLLCERFCPMWDVDTPCPGCGSFGFFDGRGDLRFLLFPLFATPPIKDPDPSIDTTLYDLICSKCQLKDLRCRFREDFSLPCGGYTILYRAIEHGFDPLSKA